MFTPGLPRIFLDSDYLFVLDALFDTVRTDVATRVIISTREVLRRMWCVIVSRRSCRQQCPYHDRQVRRLHASSEAYLHVLEKAWSEEEVHARYIKCVLTPDLPRILLDSDNLFVLDALFDTVRTDVATRVIISTREVLRRMWCVIVSRRSCRQQCPYHDRQVRRLHASSEAYLHVLEKAWSEEEVHARYIKCVLTPDLPRILLDSDNLLVLDALFIEPPALRGDR